MSEDVQARGSATFREGADEIRATLQDGRLLLVTLDRDENRLVADVVEKSGRWGNEFVRCRIPPAFTREDKRAFRRLLAKEKRDPGNEGGARD